jgi:hypothetical protein
MRYRGYTAANNSKCSSSSVLSTELKYSESSELLDYLTRFLDHLLLKTFHFGNRMCFLLQGKIRLKRVTYGP